MFAFPGLLSVIVAVLLLPTFTLLKFTLVGLIVSCGCGGAVPTPLNAIVSGEFGKLLAIEMVPLALPAVVGANFAVKEVPCAGISVTGVANPLMLKPVPDTLPEAITTLAVPVFVKVIAMESLAPVTRLPKLMLGGLALSLPCVPMPLSGIVTVGSVALLLIVMVPEALPVAVGVN